MGNRGKCWTKDEVDFLDENWGNLDCDKIASKLGKTPRAICLKAWSLGFGSPMLSADGISVNHLPGLFGITPYKVFNIWIKKYNFPYRKKRFKSKRAVRIFRLDEFWKWAEEYKDYIDFSNLERNSLGAEPCWVNAKRRTDSLKQKSNSSKSWTTEDDDKLKYLIYKFLYSRKEIADIMGRTETAVLNRIDFLKIKGRPVQGIKKHWSAEEEDIAISMHMNKVCAKDISEIMGKPITSVYHKIYRHFKKRRAELKTMLSGYMIIARRKENNYIAESLFSGPDIGIDTSNVCEVTEFYGKILTGLPINDSLGKRTGSIAEVKNIIDNNGDCIVAMFSYEGDAE